MTPPLDDVRIVDLTGPIGHYAGRLLADLGADVIKVEPPGGDEARSYLPRLPGVPEREASFQFLLLNANKRGVCFDYDSERGRESLLKLIGTADAVIDSFSPAEAERLRLTDADIRAAREDIVHTSVTGWGLSGPYAGWAYADIVGCAMSGVMALAGFPDGPPEQLPDQQGYTCASIDAAAGTMAALYYRQATGEGQLVDVAMQEALSMAQETAMMGADINGVDRVRTGASGALGMAFPGSGLYEAADGHVFFIAIGTAGSGFAGLLQFMHDEGHQQDLDKEPYVSFVQDSLNRALLAQRMQDPEEAARIGPMLEHIDDVLRAFTRAHSKRYLYEEGQRRRILVGMVSTPADIAESPQLAARRWYIALDDPGRGVTLRYPGLPWKLHRTPAALRRPAPLLGEHNEEVLREAGVPPDDLAALIGTEVVAS